MARWEYLIVLGVVLLVQFVGGIVWAVSRDRSAQRAPARIRAGRRVPVAATVLTDRVRRGRALRDGGDVRVVGRGVSFAVATEQVAAATVRRDQVDEELLELAQLHGFADEHGDHVFLGPPEEWVLAWEALLERPAAPAGRMRVLWAAVPRAGLVAGAVALAAAALFQAVWGTGHDEPATVARVEVDEDGYGHCSVRWDAGGREEGAIVDCYEPYPEVGDTLTVRALAWPLGGEAMDDEGSYEGLSAVTGRAAVVLVGATAATGLVRGLTRPRRLTALPGEPGRCEPAETDDGAALPLRELARRVAVLEGWSEEAHPAPAPPTGWQTLRDAARSPVWWFLPPAIALAVLTENVPDLLRVVIGAGVAVLLLRTVVRALRLWWLLRAVAHQPVTSEWDYVVVRGVGSEWYLFLLLGDRPRWVVGLPGDRHPRVEGRCGVRGELGDGNAVRLVIDGETWVPDGPVLREDDETRGVLRADLTERLHGAAADGAERL